MKSTFHGDIPNMRGKKRYTFSCRCCCAFDLREDYARRLAEDEIRQCSMEEKESNDATG